MTTAKPMSGKTILITGANSGIGYEAVRGLATMGATVIMHGRSRDKLTTARDAIAQAVPGADLHMLLADLSVIAEVKRLAAEVVNGFDRLDVLINNAALIPEKRTTTPDGLETQFAINHLAPFILTTLLLPTLYKSAPARIVNTSSSLHSDGRIEFDNLQSERVYAPGVVGAGWGAYSNTKLMNVLFTLELARRLDKSRVTANALHPGIIGTNLVRETGPSWLRAIGFTWFYKLIMPSPASGARTTIYLASSPEVANVTGEYFVKEKIAPMSQAARDVDAAARLWTISEQLSGVTMPTLAAV